MEIKDIEAELILHRLNNFLGYGNINSKYWFITLEDHVSEKGISELQKKFKKKNELLDVVDDMQDISSHMQFYSGEKPKLQNTVSKVIRTFFNIVDREISSNDDIRYFQRDEFARKTSNHCYLNFLPLPAPSIEERDWIYSDVNIDYLRNRSSYENEILPKRVNKFKNLISKHNPEIILLFGKKYKKYYKELIRGNFTELNNLNKKHDKHWLKMEFLKSCDTYYFILPHPAVKGISELNQLWNNYGKIIKTKIEK